MIIPDDPVQMCMGIDHTNTPQDSFQQAGLHLARLYLGVVCSYPQSPTALLMFGMNSFDMEIHLNGYPYRNRLLR